VLVTPRNVVLDGDAATVMSTLDAGSVSAVITSPPYFRARRYDAGPGELGQEETVEEWSRNLLVASREIHRVLAPAGSYWLNVGDLYSRHPRLGAPRKSLLLGPERLIRGLLDDGWIVRNRVAWVKTTPLPSPVGDRLTNSWEYLYHLVKQADYFYDLDAIRVPLTSRRRPRQMTTSTSGLGELAGPRAGLARLAAEGRTGHLLGKNPGDVWTLPTGRRIGGHVATFPEVLVQRPILATVPLRICRACGRPWRRSRRQVILLAGTPQIRPLVPCGCGAATRPGLVLDCFAGSGTTLKVARDLGRDAVGIELNSDYAEIARTRAGFPPEAPAA
jgi:site-specific DNA-methyltransferase (adenine-specific)